MKNKYTHTNEDIYSLHRYYIWANKIRTDFYGILEREEDSKETNIESTMYMSIWYGLLYVVAEGWKRLKLEDETVNELLKSKNIKLLKFYRDGTFHYQNKYDHDKFENFLKEDGTANWAYSLNYEFGRWFLENLSGANKNKT